MHDGNLKSNYDGFTGNMYVSSRGQMKPTVINSDCTPLTAADGKPYSGCYVNAQVALWAQDNGYGKRINAQLRGVQFLRDGEAFGGGAVASADEFAPVDASADADAPPVIDSAWGAADVGDAVKHQYMIFSFLSHRNFLSQFSVLSSGKQKSIRGLSDLPVSR